jgi:Zn-dependent protease/predicted transcriptional regulator
MKWSIPLGRLAGIRLFMHITFPLLLLWIGWQHWRVSATWSAVASGVGFILLLFGCVVLHELGHALAARRYGIPTRDITLLPIGGVARLERMPEEPRQELVVALAGPAVNVVIAAVLFGVLTLTGTLGTMPLEATEDTVVRGGLVQRLMVVNVMLVVFNMLPAFPLDGGRVLRAGLAMRMDYARATRTAAVIGQGMAVLFAFVGLQGNPFLLLIAFFVWMGASQESSQAQMRGVLDGASVRDAMQTDFRLLHEHDDLARAVELLLAGSQQDFPVVDGQGRVIGILTRHTLLTALARDGGSGPVQAVLQRDFTTASPTEPLTGLMERLPRVTCRAVPVVQAGQVIGLVTLENLGELVSVRTALRGARG